MVTLTALTSIVNFIALAISVWLGWYVLTRSIQKPIAWLTSLTLWSISGLFINSLLAITPPPLPSNVPFWAQFLFPFWDQNAISDGASGWLSGWLVIPAIGFWHHVTMLIRKNKFTIWQIIQTIAVYAIIILGIFAIRFTTLMYSEASGNPLELDMLKPGTLYTTFLLALLLIIIMSLNNLDHAMKRAHSTLLKRQLSVLIWATLVAGMTAPISYVAVSVDINIPRVVISGLLAISVIMIGVSVGKFSALSEGRILRRDFLYSGVAMGIVAILYSFVVWISVIIFDVPPAAYIFIIVFAFATHSIVDIARRYLDLVFYKKEDRILRQNIRELTAEIGSRETEDLLQLALDLASTSVRATFCLLLTFEGQEIKKVAATQWSRGIANISKDGLLADDYQVFESNQLSNPLDEVALLIPLYISERQIGTLLFGPPVNSLKYPETDIDRLLTVGEQISDLIQRVNQESSLLAQAAQSIQKRKIGIREPEGPFDVKNIENALRNVLDYATLGDSGLANTLLVSARIPSQNCTHLDKGKIVYEILEEAVGKLRPDNDYSGHTPPREWYPYLILHYAYFENIPNRDIMSRLYISEGTFNRTRRSAIRSVARVLTDLEIHIS